MRKAATAQFTDRPIRLQIIAAGIAASAAATMTKPSNRNDPMTILLLHAGFARQPGLVTSLRLITDLTKSCVVVLNALKKAGSADIFSHKNGKCAFKSYWQEL